MHAYLAWKDATCVLLTLEHRCKPSMATILFLMSCETVVKLVNALCNLVDWHISAASSCVKTSCTNSCLTDVTSLGRILMFSISLP